MEQLGLGIIGLGVGKGALALNLYPESPIRVRAVADLDSSLLERATGEFEVPFATTDYLELLQRADVDVVGVFTPDHLHAEHVPAALEAGKHVVCTKPMATTIEDCDRFVGLVRKTGAKFVVAQTWRFLPKIAAAKAEVDAGRIGRINFIETGYVHDIRSICVRTPWRVSVSQDFLYRRRRARHRLPSLVRGQRDRGKRLRGELKGDSRYPIQDTWILNLKFERGALGRVLVMCGSINPPHEIHQHVQIFGSKGTVIGLDIGLHDDPEHRTLPTRPAPASGPVIEGHASELLPYFHKMAEWIADDGEPEPNVVDGARGIAVAVAAHESLATGRSIEVRNEF